MDHIDEWHWAKALAAEARARDATTLHLAVGERSGIQEDLLLEALRKLGITAIIEEQHALASCVCGYKGRPTAESNCPHCGNALRIASGTEIRVLRYE